MDKQYKCPENGCDWVGTEDEMEADFQECEDRTEEVWSNWICPSCGYWHQLNNYEEVKGEVLEN
jgi:hypothetical protein